MTVYLVAREAGITTSQLCQWRKAYAEGSLAAVGANEPVVPASDLQDAMKRIRQLEAALGRKTLEHVYRIMRDHSLLLYRQGQRPLDTQRHDGKVAVEVSNTRWCSDGFELSCDNGERARVAFALDCCDREVMS